MNQNAKRTRRRSISVLVILTMITVIHAWALRPVPAYADSGAATASALDALLAGPVPLYSQLDNLGAEWTSCGPTSLAMVLNYRRAGPTPQGVVDYATSHTGQDGEPLYKPHDPAKVFTSPQHLYEIAGHYGDPVQGWATDKESARRQLRELLGDDLPVIVDVTVSISKNGSTAAHFVVVTGIDAGDTVYLNDPYGGGVGGQRRAVAWEDFYWAWQNNGGGHIGGHGWWMVAETPQATSPVAVNEPPGSEVGPPRYPFSYDDLFIPIGPICFYDDVALYVPK